MWVYGRRSASLTILRRRLAADAAVHRPHCCSKRSVGARRSRADALGVELLGQRAWKILTSWFLPLLLGALLP